jgi:PAS domain S-box-containing protein
MTKTKVLYIENDDDQRVELKDLLQERDFEVADCASGEAGMEALASSEGFDIVVCDLNMPGMSGMDVLQTVSDKHSELPFILVTAHPSVPQAVQAIQRGAYRFLTKPVNIDELELTIYQALEHARLQRWLREADEQLRLLVETSPVPYIISRLQDGRVLYANRHLASLVGLSPDEVRSRYTTEFYDNPEDRKEIMRRLQADGSINDFELRIKTASGQAIWAVLSLATMEMAGEPVVIGALLNITQRKEAEEELVRQRNFVSAVLDTAGALVVVADTEGRLVRVNPACEEITGYSAREILGRSFMDIFILAEEQAIVWQRMERIRTGPWPVRGENYWRTKTGECRLIEWSNTALRNEKGELEFIVAIGIDITEAREAEEKLRLYHEIYMNSIDVIMVLDTEGRIVERNPAHEKKSGYKDDEVLGKQSRQFFGKTQLREINEHLAKEDSYRGEILGTKKDGTPIWVDLSIFPILDQHDKPYRYIAMGRDITAMKMALADLAFANQELRDTQSQLVQSEKMASLGSLVAGIAHEINTPVGAIKSMHDTLIRAVDKLKRRLEERFPDELEEDRQIRTAFDIIGDANEVIESGASRVTEIVRRLRSFARLDEAELKKIDIHEGLEDTLTLVHHEIKHHIKINRNYGELPPLSVYPGRLNQVFLNILNNARQAIEGKGEITIKTWEKYRKAHISISDTGAGISRDNLKNVFDPGFTTKGVGVGTGLGLSICYQIIQEHRGEIKVESEEGKGTTFTIVLPMNLDALLGES